MTTSEIITDSLVPGTRSVFFLGCFDSRVTIYAQQVRALNLVDALIQDARLREGASVAVVGAGIAGVTAAAALAVAVPSLRHIDLYDRRPDLLHLQLESQNRFVHPHLYDWPSPGSLRETADLPLLDWRAGTAGEVASQIGAAFRSLREDNPKLTLKLGKEVSSLLPAPQEGCRVSVTDDLHGGGFYDLVILGIGFGYEKAIDERNRSYWDPAIIAGPLRTQALESHILISGNGDGGLVDFITAAFSGISHKAISDTITNRNDLEAAKQLLLTIDEKAWRGQEPTLDIFAEYTSWLLPILPPGLLLDVTDRLRNDAKVLFHARQNHVFRRDTALLNRLIAFLAIVADQNSGRHKIQVLTGTEFATSPQASNVAFTTGATFSPSLRYLRFGANKEENLRPFSSLAEAVQRERAQRAFAYRPVSPALTPDALSRFEPFRAANVAPTEAHATAVWTSIGEVLVIQIRREGPDHCEWRSTVPIIDVRKLWASGTSQVVIECDFSPNDDPRLSLAVARLAAHVQSCRLFAPDSHAWIDFLKTFNDLGKPGPNVEMKFTARRRALTSPLLPLRASLSSSAIAVAVQDALDAEVEARLSELVNQSLAGSNPSPMGWTIEEGLRAAMLQKWMEWHELLRADENKRRRFLILLACVDDDVLPPSSAHVYIGPKVLRAHMLRATLLALAFSVAVSAPFSPQAAFPGNLAANSMTAHASGVSWAGGRDLGPDIGAHGWSTRVVLLSELHAARVFIRAALPRLDAAEGKTRLLDEIDQHERPLVLGCDHDLVTALGEGRESLRAYVSSVLRERADGLQKLIEAGGTST